MNLVFTPLEIAAVAAAVGISALIAIDGETNWLEGALLVLVYVDPGDLVLRVRGAALMTTKRGRIDPASIDREPRRAYATVTVPVISGWISQWYANVPAVSNVCENDASAAIVLAVEGPVIRRHGVLGRALVQPRDGRADADRQVGRLELEVIDLGLGDGTSGALTRRRGRCHGGRRRHRGR